MKMKLQTVRRAQRCLDTCQEPTDSLRNAALTFGSAARARRSSLSAFTLIETIVATMLAGIMLPTLFAGLAYCFSLVQASRENLRATQILVQRMEAVRLSPYNALSNPTAYPTNVSEYYSPSGQTNWNRGTVYTVTYKCEPGPSTLPPSYRSNIVLVTVTAAWNSGKTQQTRSMQSYVARYGMQRYVSGN